MSSKTDAATAKGEKAAGATYPWSSVCSCAGLLCQSQRFKSTAGPAVFRCQGLRVVCWAPEEVRDLAVPYCQACQRLGTREVWGSQGLIWYSCKHCQRHLDPASPFVYEFCLTLTDATSWVSAHVSKAEAESFLGLPAVDLYANEAAAAQVEDRLEALVQNGRRRGLPSAAPSRGRRCGQV